MNARLTGFSTPFIGASWEYKDNKEQKAPRPIIPDEKIKVFISSICGEDKYDRIRAELKQAIENTQLANVYTFEGKGASTLSAGNHYTFALEDSDVCIFLIDNADGIRAGVQAEIDTVNKHGIKALYYFCDQTSKEKTTLEQSLMGAQYAKSKTVHRFDELSQDGAKALINDIISVYHHYCAGRIVLNTGQNESDTQSIELTGNEKYQIPTMPRYVIKNTNKCRNYILKLITGYERKYSFIEKESTSAIDDWGVQFFSVLFEGKSIKQFNTGMFMEELKVEQSNEYFEIVELRWKAIQSYYLDDVEKCIEYLQKALGKAKESKQLTWVIKDILIDIRNQHNLRCIIQNRHYESEAQKELSESGEELYYPIIDRINESLNETYIEELYDQKIKSPYSVSLGSLDRYAEMLASIYIVAMYNGSLTQLLLLYDKMKNLLFFLSSKYDDWHFRRDMYKFAIYAGEEKEVKGIQESYPEIHNNLTVEEAADIIEFCNNNPIKYKRLNCQLKAFGAIGYYLDDKEFQHYEENIIRQIKEWLNDEDSIVAVGNNIFKCLLAVAHRINKDTIAEICCLFIEKHYSRWYLDMFKIIAKHLDINKLKPDVMKRLIACVEGILDNPKEREQVNFYPIFLCVMRKQNRQLTEGLDRRIQEYFPNYYKESYRLETEESTEADLLEYIKKYIEIIKNHNATQGKNGAYFGHGVRAIATLQSFLMKKNEIIDNETMDDIISTVADTILQSKEGVPTKIDAIVLLCYITLKHHDDYIRNKSIFDKIYLNKDSIEASDTSLLSSNISTLSLKIGLQILFTSMGMDVFAELLELMPYIQNDTATIISVEHTIVEYLEISDSIRLPEKMEAIILQNVLLWLCSENLNIRWYATRILMHLLRNKENWSIINHRMISLIDSDGVYIKNLILRSLNDFEGLYEQTKDHIFSKCKNDANYVVRMVYEQEMRKYKLSTD